MAKGIKNSIPWIFGLVTLAYPLVVYFGIQHFSPATFALFFLVSGAARFYLTKDKKDLTIIVFMAIIVVYILALLFINDAFLLLLYPAFVSLSVAILFAVSLKQKTSLIERVAMAAGNKITVNAKRYTWRLTVFWSGILIVNSAVCFYLALAASRELCALYSGLVCYLIFAVIGVIEYGYRRYYIAKFGA